MQDIIELLQAWTRDLTGRNAVARQNIEAAGADADDIAQAVEQGESAHREFSIFTKPQGRA